jgi:hypothetical protein
MSSKFLRASAAALAVIAMLGQAALHHAHAAAQDYRFALAGEPTVSGGKSVVQVRLMHMPNGKPVARAVIFEHTADMAPAGMPNMTAPVSAASEIAPGLYQLAIEPAMAGAWALTLAAKVQGETETVRGTLTVKLAK